MSKIILVLLPSLLACLAGYALKEALAVESNPLQWSHAFLFFFLSLLWLLIFYLSWHKLKKLSQWVQRRVHAICQGFGQRLSMTLGMLVFLGSFWACISYALGSSFEKYHAQKWLFSWGLFAYKYPLLSLSYGAFLLICNAIFLLFVRLWVKFFYLNGRL